MKIQENSKPVMDLSGPLGSLRQTYVNLFRKKSSKKASTHFLPRYVFNFLRLKRTKGKQSPLRDKLTLNILFFWKNTSKNQKICAVFRASASAKRSFGQHLPPIKPQSSTSLSNLPQCKRVAAANLCSYHLVIAIVVHCGHIRQQTNP